MTDDARAPADHPLVSVILPTYNRPSKLREAVHSVAEQSYPALELIVVDDHSTKPAKVVLSEETATESLSSVRIVRHEENRGANAARNTGIRRARGELVSFLDDDDRWLKRKTDKQVRRFENGPDDLGVVTVGSRNVDAEGNRIGVVRSSVAGDAVDELLYGGIVGSFSRVMAKAAVISEAGLLDESFPSWQDREWYLRLAQHCQFGSEDEVLVERRFDAGHRISDDFEQKRDVSYPRFLEKHRQLAAERGLLTERRFVAALSRTLAFSGLANGYYREAIKYLLVSLAYYPFDPKTYLYLCLAVGGPVTFKSAQRIKRGYSRTLAGLG
jgi:glycosyltransferase involved in cell wall biosynthesis